MAGPSWWAGDGRPVLIVGGLVAAVLGFLFTQVNVMQRQLSVVLTLVEERTADRYTATQAAGDQNTLTVILQGIMDDVDRLEMRVDRIEADHDRFALRRQASPAEQFEEFVTQ